MSLLLQVWGQQFGFHGALLPLDDPWIMDRRPWMMDLRVLGGVAMDSAGLRDWLCALPATPIAGRALFAALKAPRLIHGLLNTLGSATSLQAATIGGTLSGRQRYSPEAHGSFGSVL